MEMAARDRVLCVWRRKRKSYVSRVEIIFSRKFSVGINTRTGLRASVLWV